MDAGYLFEPQKGRSQTRYIFTCGGVAISWRFVKQTLVATTSNYFETLTLYEASCEYMWLRSMIRDIRETCGMSSTNDTLTILQKDNAAYSAQIRNDYTKGDRIKHISLKFFHTHKRQQNGDINVQQIQSRDNLAY